MHHKKTVFLLILAVRPLTRRKYMFCKWLLISIILPSNTANATRPLKGLMVSVPFASLF